MEELNSKDSWLLWHKDSVIEEWQLKGEELLQKEFKQQMEQIKKERQEKSLSKSESEEEEIKEQSNLN